MWNNRPPFGQPQFFGFGPGRAPFQQQQLIQHNPFGLQLPMNNFPMMQRFGGPDDQRPLMMRPRQPIRPRREPGTNYTPPKASDVNPPGKFQNTNEKDQQPKTVETQFSKSVSAQPSGSETKSPGKSNEKTLSQPLQNEQTSSESKNKPDLKSDTLTNLAQQNKNSPQVQVTSQPPTQSSEASKDVKGTLLMTENTNSPTPPSLPSTSKASTEKFGQGSNSGNDTKIKFPPNCHEGTWFCRMCKNINFKFRTRCFKCNGQRKDTEAPMPSKGDATPASGTPKNSLLEKPWLPDSGADCSPQQENPPVPNVSLQKPVQNLAKEHPASFESFPPRPLPKQPLLNVGSQQQQLGNPRMPPSQFVGNRMPFQGSQPIPRFVPPFQSEPSFETFPPPIRPAIQSSRPALLNPPPMASAAVPGKSANPMSESANSMSEQEVEFNKMFQNWEESFEKWKSENINNPDRDYVNSHIKHMNELRERLLERRKKLFRTPSFNAIEKDVKGRNEKIPESASAPPVTRFEPSQLKLTQKLSETQQSSRPFNASFPKESLQQKAQPPRGFQAESFKNQAQAPHTSQIRQPISAQEPKKLPVGFGESFEGFQQINPLKTLIEPSLSAPSAKSSQKTEYSNLSSEFQQHSKFESMDSFERSDLKEKLKKNRVVIDYNHQAQSSANDYDSKQHSWNKDNSRSSQSSDKYYVVDYDHQFDDKVSQGRPSASQSFCQDLERKKRFGESSSAQSPKRGRWNEPNLDFRQQKDLDYFSKDYTSSKFGTHEKPDDVAWDSYQSHKVMGDRSKEKTQGSKHSLGQNLPVESGSIRKKIPDQRNSFSPPGRSGRMKEEWPEKFDKWHGPSRHEETDFDRVWGTDQKGWQSGRSSNFEKTDYSDHTPRSIPNPFSENETKSRQSYENFPERSRFGQDGNLHQKSSLPSSNFEKNSRQESSSDNWTRSHSIERREMEGTSNSFRPYSNEWSRNERSPNSNTGSNDRSSARNDFPWSKGNNPPSSSWSRSDISPGRSNSQRGFSLDQKYGHRRDEENFHQEQFNPKDFHSSSYERIPPPLQNDVQYSRHSYGQSKMDEVTESKNEEEEEDWFRKNYKGGQSFRRSSPPAPSFYPPPYEGNDFKRQNLNDLSTSWVDKFSHNRGQTEAEKSFGRSDFQSHQSGQLDTKSGSELTKPVFMGVPHPTRPLPDLSDKVVSFDELFKPPGRFKRPKRMVLVLRGLPGSGKTPFAKAVKQLEATFTKEAPRILSINDYFENDGEYEYDEKQEAVFMTSLVKSFRKQIDDGFFDFIIVDAVNEMTAHYEEIWSHSKLKGFEVYICEFPDKNPKTLSERSVHKRSRDDLQRIAARWEETPRHYKLLNINTYLQDQEIENVDMESEDSHKEVPKRGLLGNFKNSDDEEDSKPGSSLVLSKWEIMEDNDKIDRLDGVSANARKKMSQPKTIDDWLELSERQAFSTDGKGKKRVRWADIEESAAQIRMRDVGFIVGQTNWNRMLDPNAGQSALNRTKIIPNRFQI